MNDHELAQQDGIHPDVYESEPSAREERELGWFKRRRLKKLCKERDRLVEEWGRREELLEECRRLERPTYTGWPTPQRRAHLDEQVRIERRLAEVRTQIHRLEGEIRNGKPHKSAHLDGVNREEQR